MGRSSTGGIECPIGKVGMTIGVLCIKNGSSDGWTNRHTDEPTDRRTDGRSKSLRERTVELHAINTCLKAVTRLDERGGKTTRPDGPALYIR